MNIMNARAQQLLDELLKLPAEDRALIAAELEASLDQDASPEVIEKLWADEIRRRVQRVSEGRSTGRDGRTVLAEIRAKLATMKR